MKVLFLDIDDVLNTRASRHKHGIDRIDPDKALMVDALCRETGAVIVLSSDWRLPGIYGLDRTVADLRNVGVTVAIIGSTPDMPLSPLKYEDRRNEILTWLADQPVERFAIIDDLPIRHRYAVQVGRLGLEAGHVKRLARILGPGLQTGE